MTIATTTASVFEAMIYRKIKKGLSDKLDNLLIEIIDNNSISAGEKKDAETKCFEMFRKAMEEFIARNQ